MLASELDYELPESLIAQHPPQRRDGGRLLRVGQTLADLEMREFGEFVPADALVVLNDTRVMKARVYAERPTGGRLEVLFLDAHPERDDVWQVMVRSNRPMRTGDRANAGGLGLTFGERTGQGTRWVEVDGNVERLLAEHGHVPLPPYMRRADELADEERYQTVFAAQLGSAAAPTAGLHLTQTMLARMQARGVEVARLTLHVGAGTFKPVGTATVEEHPMHRERYALSEAVCAQVEAARDAGRPIVAIGTTVVRALESAGETGLRPGAFATDLLITPGYQFRVVDALLTNFHAPRSTLLALVYAFAGTERTRRAYVHAVEAGYRFLSYGDAMWIPARSS